MGTRGNFRNSGERNDQSRVDHRPGRGMSLTLTLMLEQTLSMDEEAPLLDPEDEYESAAPEVPDGVARPTGPDSPGS